MDIIFIILGIILLLLLLVMLLPVKVVLEYKGESKIKVFVYGIKVYDSRKKHSAQSESEQAQEEKPKDESKYLEKLKSNFDVLKQILKVVVEKVKKYVIIEDIEVKYRFGLFDAAVTGIYSGVVYGVINGFAAYIRNYFKIKNQKLEVIPDFDNQVQEFEAKVVLIIRAAFFVPVLLRLLKLFNEKKEV